MKKYLASNLRYLRKKTNKTQDSIALEVNRKNTTISNWENDLNDPSVDELLILSSIFEISIDDLIKTDLSKGNLKEKGRASKSEQKGKLIGNPLGNLMEPEMAYSTALQGLTGAPGEIVRLVELHSAKQQADTAFLAALIDILRHP